jgi:hypothetical protein
MPDIPPYTPGVFVYLPIAQVDLSFLGASGTSRRLRCSVMCKAAALSGRQFRVGVVVLPPGGAMQQL